MTINSEKWIQSLPNEWSITKIGNHFKCRNEKVNDADYPPLSVAKQGVVPQIETVAKTDANDNRKLVLMNDFVINSRSDRKESCGLSKLNGSVSLINHVLYQNGQDYYMPFVGILFKNYGFAEEFYRWGHGIVADLWTTRWQEMKNIEIPLPPLKEQKLIFDFLTNRTSKIDQLISNQEKQIEKLKEYKQSLINQNVFNGKKYFIPLKKCCLLNKESLKDTNNPLQPIEYVEIGDVTLEDGIKKTESFLFKNAPSRARRKTKMGDIIVSTVRTYLKAIAIVDKKGLIVSTGFAVLEPINVSTKYLGYVLKTDYFTSSVSANSNGINYPSITSESLINLKIPTCDKETQEKISVFLDDKCNKINKLIKIKNQKIENLKDYKKSLIYEYVAGKKRVLL